MPVRRTVYFNSPHKVEVRKEPIPAPAPGRMLVETCFSAISPGTEMLLYRGEFPDRLAVDASLPALAGDFHYPLCYGYAAVGQVTQLGDGLAQDWLGRQVFSFQPHTSAFLAAPEELFPVPEGFSAETAAFLANAETAVNLVQDGAPLLGERALVCGQGIVGLLTAALLAEFPLEALVTCDSYACRRAASSILGVTASLDPQAADFQGQARTWLGGGADLSYELSGAPAALDQAIGLTAFSGRVVIGSWYGKKRAALDLGGEFHRSRLRLISSQVSSIAPELSGRWDKSRRFTVAWNALRRIRPEKWITHRFPLEAAADAYRLLDEAPSETIQVIFQHHEH